MSVREVTMYTIVCDRCGCDACYDTDYKAWADVEGVRECSCEGWEEIDGKDYCPDCLVWNDDETELIPKP